MFRSRRRGGSGFPLFLLAFQVFRAISGGREIFPVTLGLIIGNVVAFIQPSFGGQRYSRYSSTFFNWPEVRDVCISAGDVWYKEEWSRIALSPFFHLNEWHIYYNMASLIWKGISLERHYGSVYFLYMTTVFSALTGVVYCGLEFALAEFTGEGSYVWQCAAGFSGVLFALKVVTTYGMPRHTVYLMGFVPVPSRHAAWAELVLIHLLVPGASFVGHLAGIVVGMLFVKGPLKLLMDLPFGGVQWLAAGAQSREGRFQASGRSGYRPQTHQQPSQERQIAADENSSEDEELQAAIRESLQVNPAGRSHHSASTSARPPPYNPEHTDNANHVDNSMDGSYGADVEEVGEREDHPGVSTQSEPLQRSSSYNLRHRPPKQPSTERDSLDHLRAARLNRFRQQ